MGLYLSSVSVLPQDVNANIRRDRRIITDLFLIPLPSFLYIIQFYIIVSVSFPDNGLFGQRSELSNGFAALVPVTGKHVLLTDPIEGRVLFVRITIRELLLFISRNMLPFPAFSPPDQPRTGIWNCSDRMKCSRKPFLSAPGSAPAPCHPRFSQDHRTC